MLSESANLSASYLVILCHYCPAFSTLHFSFLSPQLQTFTCPYVAPSSPAYLFPKKKKLHTVLPRCICKTSQTFMLSPLSLRSHHWSSVATSSTSSLQKTKKTETLSSPATPSLHCQNHRLPYAAFPAATTQAFLPQCHETCPCP